MELVMNQEIIKKHFAPLFLRANRLVSKINLKEMALRLNLNPAQVSAIELGCKYSVYKNKSILHSAYGLTDEQVIPSDEQVERLKKLLSDYSPMEITMAYDLLDAEVRVEKALENIRRSQSSIKKPENMGG